MGNNALMSAEKGDQLPEHREGAVRIPEVPVEPNGWADPLDRYVELLKLSLLDLVGPATTRAVPKADGSGEVLLEEVPEGERSERLIGRDWPANGTTMVGLARLENLQQCIETILTDAIPGDLIETGVWRGGATIFMRALLDIHRDLDRLVWVVDSFAGLPPPDAAAYPADSGDAHHTVDFLAVSLEEVKRHFIRYGISTERVRFLQGWFRDTLPTLTDAQWSLIRLDGDMYESTMLGLEQLYPRLSPGGFIIVDDYGAVAGCKRAIDDFRARNEISETLVWVDWTGVYWRKNSQAQLC
jgi:O-methyltransferase